MKLVVFDMEGCLTADPTVWEVMHRRNGTWESHGLPYWDSYRAGRIGYDEFARLDVAAWRGASKHVLSEAAEAPPLMPGAARLLDALADAGVATAIISNGLLCAAERFRRDHGVAHVAANRARVEDGLLTGELDLLVPYDAKGEEVRRLAARMGLSSSDVAAVGDSPADVAMFRWAGLGIAFGAADEGVASAATHVVTGGDLRALLPILLGG